MGDHISGPINALIVDDDDFDRRRISRMGAASGLDLNFISVPTISEMRNRLDDTTFDLIFLDYRLSNETGLEALDYIQQHAANAKAAKVMLTGNMKMDIAVTALKNGCHDYVSKDVLSPDMLRQTVQAVLSKARQAALADQERADMIDRAVYELAAQKLPELLAMVLTSPQVTDAMGPYISNAIEKGITKSLAQYDLPPNVLSQPDIQGLVHRLSEDHQIHLND